MNKSIPRNWYRYFFAFPV